ncbi:acetyl-CoA carboxylase biotin carboxylase subunit [Rhodococcoides fascians]|uniref:acetyl-CoA carboxylase biotin carboxylase subunit n=1 Tax=Rhodococcoides fascians TaxID=1828 RepID=UPI000560C741|nr:MULTISPECIES: biotin carboxylase N-terminal domain-containing protein [Rhodococcus]OZF06405.1 acetyl-CoA carboxylase biotin carboxylase subunit [Rhodococcus sp. 15-1189-1-1a]OZF21210.1 acetyl-CoA carboxylase biotin carboxylase subunit [Rhodococcus sp. 14-2686-1-2]
MSDIEYRPIKKVFVANRGEIAVRVIRSCRELGIETVLAVSTVDRESVPARLADRTVCIGPPTASASYLNMAALITAALGSGCDALHPGYGFLSENPEFAQMCVDNGLTFVGPAPHVVAEAGDKARAREIARAAGIPVLTGSPILTDVEAASRAAAEIGYPVLVKASAGGGGRGMSVVENDDELRARFSAAGSEAQSAFGDGSLFVEKYIRRARHIEVQVLGDRHGGVVQLGERDCTLQRRHQKVVEESPAPGLDEATQSRIRASGLAFAEAIGLDSAGTVEFIYDADTGDYAFLEFNARIQVEHPVTEAVTGVDLVRQQLRSAQGDRLEFGQGDVTTTGHAIEVRITSESPRDGFLPRAGTLVRWRIPDADGIRVDTHAEEGYVVSPYYDSLLAKVVAYGTDRDDAIARMLAALSALDVQGVPTTADFAHFALDHTDFRTGHVSTNWIAETGLPEFLETP